LSEAKYHFGLRDKREADNSNPERFHEGKKVIQWRVRSRVSKLIFSKTKTFI